MPAVVPVIFYKDPIAAMKWLEKAFGFETTALLIDNQGRVAHSEMVFGDSTIGVAGEWTGPQLGGAHMKSPASVNGDNTQFLRVFLTEDLDAHCERARAAGARITDEPKDQFYGDRTYRAADPDGHIWNFALPVREVDIDELHKSFELRTVKLEEA
jgi:uncharacterized glyoxalase superfamily protein PhnB